MRTASEEICYVVSFVALETQVQGLPYTINLLKPAGHVMHQQFNIQQLYVLPTL